MTRFARLLGQTALAGVVVTAYGIQSAQAQVPTARFSSGSSARAQEQVKASESTAMRQATPSLEIRQAPPAQAPVGAEKAMLTLKSVNVAGSTVYSDAELSTAYAGMVGQRISLADVYGIAAELTRKYREDGYVLSQVTVPPQTIESGEIKLQAVEGRLGAVTIRGAEGAAYANPLGMARSYAAQIDRNGPLRYGQLERATLLINDLPGVRARSILSPSPNESGVADLLIIVDRDGYDAQVSVDNYGTPYLGSLQLGAAGSINSQFFKNDEKITAQLVLAPGDIENLEMVYFAASYWQPLTPNGLALELFGNGSNTTPGHTLRAFNVEGQNAFLGASLSYPFIRSRVQSLSGHATFDYRNVSSTSNIDIERADHIRAIRLGGRYELLDTLINTAFNTVDFEVSQGVDILGASDSGLASLSRPAGDPTFTKFNIELQRLQNIYGSINLLAGVRWQYSDNPLLSAEQFGVGGGNYGRGYDSSEIIGDRGVAGKVELQWNQPYKIEQLNNYQLYTFWDGGHVRTLAPVGSTDSISSAGFGVRAAVDDKTAAGLMVAKPLTRDVQSENGRPISVYFNVSRKF